MNKPKIYIFQNGSWSSGDVVGAALAEDGTYLAGHLSSSIGFLKHDMGLTSNWKHDRYKKHYPDGYELVWLDSVKDLPKEILERNQAMKPKESVEAKY